MDANIYRLHSMIESLANSVNTLVDKVEELSYEVERIEERLVAVERSNGEAEDD